MAKASTRIGPCWGPHGGPVAIQHQRLHVPRCSAPVGTKITGYRGSFSTSIEVHDFDALSDLVFTLTGAEQPIDGPRWSVRPETPVYREVRLPPSSRPPPSERLCRLGNLSVGRLLEISDLDAGSVGRRSPGGLRRRPAKASFDFERPRSRSPAR